MFYPKLRPERPSHPPLLCGLPPGTACPLLAEEPVANVPQAACGKRLCSRRTWQNRTPPHLRRLRAHHSKCCDGHWDEVQLLLPYQMGVFADFLLLFGCASLVWRTLKAWCQWLCDCDVHCHRVCRCPSVQEVVRGALPACDLDFIRKRGSLLLRGKPSNTRRSFGAGCKTLPYCSREGNIRSRP